MRFSAGRIRPTALSGRARRFGGSRCRTRSPSSRRMTSSCATSAVRACPSRMHISRSATRAIRSCLTSRFGRDAAARRTRSISCAWRELWESERRAPGFCSCREKPGSHRTAACGLEHQKELPAGSSFSMRRMPLAGYRHRDTHVKICYNRMVFLWIGYATGRHLLLRR